MEDNFVSVYMREQNKTQQLDSQSLSWDSSTLSMFSVPAPIVFMPEKFSKKKIKNVDTCAIPPQHEGTSQ